MKHSNSEEYLGSFILFFKHTHTYIYLLSNNNYDPIHKRKYND